MDYFHDNKGGTSKNGLLFEKAFGTKELAAEQKYCYLAKNNLNSQFAMEFSDMRNESRPVDLSPRFNACHTPSLAPSYYSPVGTGNSCMESTTCRDMNFMPPAIPDCKSRSGTLKSFGGEEEFMSDPPLEKDDPGRKKWRKFTCALTISIITGIVTILLVHFLAELYDISKLVLIFTLITTFLMVLLNMRNIIGLCVGFYEFLASLNGQMFILIWIIILVLVGPVSEKVNNVEHDTNRPTPRSEYERYTTDVVEGDIINNSSTSVSSAAASPTLQQDSMSSIDIQMFIDQLRKNQSSVTHKVSQSIHQMQASMLKHLKMAKDATVDQCEQDVRSIKDRVNRADESSECWSGFLGDSAAAGRREKESRNKPTTPVARQTTNNDPISRIISMGTADIEAQRPAAKFQPLSEEPVEPTFCPCCSQHLTTLEKLCLVFNELNDHWTVNIISDSQTTEEVLSRMILQYFDTTQIESGKQLVAVKPDAPLQPVPTQDSQVTSNVSYDFDPFTQPRSSQPCDFVHYIAASFAALSVAVLIWHYFEISFLANKRFTMDSFDHSSVCRRFAPILILLLLSTQINVIITFLKLSGKLELPNSEALCPDSVCFSWTVGCMLAAWALLGASYCAISLKLTTSLLKRRQSRKLALLVAQVAQEPKGKKGDNLLNLNVINNPIGLNNSNFKPTPLRIQESQQPVYRKPDPELMKSSRV